MTKKHEIEFANFILRFGQNNFFVDLFEQIVFPAFTDNKLVRDTGEAQFFFRNVSLHNFGDDNNPIVALVGRHIKNTILQREQFFDEESNQVIPDRRSIDSSPSAVFVIILNHHRLMYYGETKNSPSLNSFEATLKKFIRGTYNNFVNELYEQNETQYTKKFLRDEYFPSLDIVSLTRERSIEDFINQYGLLRRVEIDLLTPNQEIDNNEFFRQARLKKEEAQSKKTAIVHSNSNEGLSLGGITRQINSALMLKSSHPKILKYSIPSLTSDRSFALKLPIEDREPLNHGTMK